MTSRDRWPGGPWTLTLVLALLLPIPAFAAADLLAPLATRNQSPLVRIHGLPADLDPDLPPAGVFQAGLARDVANKGECPPGLLTIGGTIALPGAFTLDFRVGEEVPVETASEFTFHLAPNRGI